MSLRAALAASLQEEQEAQNNQRQGAAKEVTEAAEAAEAEAGGGGPAGDGAAREDAKKKKKKSTTKKKKKGVTDFAQHAVPAPRSAFVLFAAKTHGAMREAAGGLGGMTKRMKKTWRARTEKERSAGRKREAADRKRFDRTRLDKKTGEAAKLTFAQLRKAFVFPQGLELLEKEIANTVSLWDGGYNEACEACGKGGNVMLCEACNLVYHRKCLKIKALPEQDVPSPGVSWCLLSSSTVFVFRCRAAWLAIMPQAPMPGHTHTSTLKTKALTE